MDWPFLRNANHRNWKIFAVILFLSFLQRDIHAGAWTLKKGSFYYKLGVLRFKATSQFLLNGNQRSLANNGSVTDINIYQYLEYGLYDDLTFVGTLPFKKTSFDCSIEDCNKNSHGLADIQFGIRYRLSKDTWVVALQSGFKFSTGYETDEEKLDSAPPLGDGQTDFNFKVLLGRSIFNYGGYLNLDLGFRSRSGEPVDEIPFAIEFGLSLSSHYILSMSLHGVRSISEDSEQENFQIINGQVEDFVGTGAVEDFVNFQLQFTYKITSKYDVSFSFDQILAGRNTSKASTVGLGFAIHN